MPPSSVTFAVVGNLAVGKTQLVEALAHEAGATNRLGSLSEGTSHLATHAEEKERGMSLFTAVACFQSGQVRLQALDTPGFPDLRCDRVSSLAVADAAIVVVDAVKGVDMAARRILALARRLGLPAMVVMTKMDSPEADPDSWRPLQSGFPVVGTQAITGFGNSFSTPDSHFADPTTMPEALVEAIVEQDDDLLEAYLEEGEVSPDLLWPAFHKGVAAGEIVPVLYVSGTTGVGIPELLTAITTWLPGPEGSAFAKRAGMDGDGPTALQVFKTRYEGQLGEVQFARLARGTLVKGATLKNLRSHETERLTQFYSVFGTERTPMDKAVAGDIVALVKLKHTLTGDSLVAGGDAFPPIPYPTPVSREAIRATDERQEEKVMEAMGILLREDPAITFGYDPDIRQNIITCFGEVQLAVLLSRLQREFGLEAVSERPQVPYRESFAAPIDAMYRHKKQSGGRGQFAECHIRVIPTQRGEGFTFTNKIVGGKIPEKFVSSVEKGVREAMAAGTMVGAPVVDFEVQVNDGKTHDVDSSDIAFQIAGRFAFREAEKRGRKLLLEPFYRVEVLVPERMTGEIIGDLNSRRGRIASLDPAADPGMSVIRADVPLKEMYKYDNTLRSIAKGDGSYTMEATGYEEVPKDLTQKLIAAAQAEKEEG
ncbi:elongation factor G [bacterium]|nr:elongation factor G [bacterium]